MTYLQTIDQHDDIPLALILHAVIYCVPCQAADVAKHLSRVVRSAPHLFRDAHHGSVALRADARGLHRHLFEFHVPIRRIPLHRQRVRLLCLCRQCRQHYSCHHHPCLSSSHVSICFVFYRFYPSMRKIYCRKGIKSGQLKRKGCPLLYNMG